MLTRYRAFSETFLYCMERRGGWPIEKDVKPWFRQNVGGYSTGEYGKLRHGGYAAEKYTSGFIEMLVKNPGKPEFKQAQRSLQEYLCERGIHSLTQVNLDGILSHVCGPLTDAPPDGKKSRFIDYLMWGIQAIGHFHVGHTVDNYVQGCGEEREIREAIEWMYVRVGQCVAPEGPSMSREDVIAAGAQHMQIGMAEYQERAIAWHALNPWTVVRARHKTGPVGMSIVLPLTEQAYADVLEGRKATYDCTESDLTIPSRHLMIEACAERPEAMKLPKVNPSKSMFMSMALQLSALARCYKSRPAPVHFLTFAGTPLNRQRSLDTGFKVTGKAMAGTGVELLEKIVPIGSLANNAFLESALLLYFGWLCPDAPPL